MVTSDMIQGLNRQAAMVLCGVLLLVALPSSRAPAITGGVVDQQNRYPNVGAIVLLRLPEFPNLPTPFALCTGTLIHPRVFLTAGHCTDFIVQRLNDGRLTLDDIRVSFGVNALDPSTWLRIERMITHPKYPGERGVNPPDLNDVGVVILESPQHGLPLAVLPLRGYLDSLRASGQLRQPGQGGARFTVVGYGTVLDFPPPRFPWPDGLRRVAQSEYLALRRDWLYLSQNLATGNGGTGYGDSGGPTFWKDRQTGTEILVSITSRGDPMLVSTGITQRIDIPKSLDFIESVLADFD